MLQLRHDLLMVLVHFIKLKGLTTEPVSFPLQVHEPIISLRPDPLRVRLFLQIAHVPLNDVHLLLEGLQEVVFMLLNFPLDELSSVLYNNEVVSKYSKTAFFKPP